MLERPCLTPPTSPFPAPPLRHDFADAMAKVTAVIRRDRRPLPSHELDSRELTSGDRRRWARAVLEAEDRTPSPTSGGAPTQSAPG